VTNARDRIVVLDGEHSSVYAPAKYLAENGFSVGFVPLLKTGECDLDALVRAVAPTGSAIFRAGEGAGVTVVFGLVNSDVGTIQDAKTIVERIRAVSPRAHIHMDATQAFCKIPFNVSELGVDSVSISAHKIHGPKGVGALWVRKGVTLRAQMLGGGQQALRAGTENNPGVVGFGRAVELFDTEKHFAFVSELHGRLATAMEEIGARRLGGGKNPYISMWILPNRVFGQTIMNALGEVGVLVGLGSACNGTNRNRTLTAMGVSDADAKSVLRISLSSFNTAAEIDVFVEKISKILKSLS
jgi:cysteine desulfurase